MAFLINAQIADYERLMLNQGFTTGIDNLWVPQFGWKHEEMTRLAAGDGSPAEKPHPPQYLAALKIFCWMFCASGTRRVWLHLAAEMQAGKTGVLNTLIRLMFANHRHFGITPADIFVLTGMSDKAWRKQTCERLPSDIKPGVEINPNMKHVAAAIRRKASAEGGLKNLLVALDESHIAADRSNEPKKVFDTILELAPLETWAERNIRILTISATDPAKVLGITDATQAQMVRLQTTNLYQSVESLKNAGRLHESKDLITDTAVRELHAFIATTYGNANAPRYHIIRPRRSKRDETMRLLQRFWPMATVVGWDAGEKPARESEDGSTSTLEDINEMLSVKPDGPVFIVLKNMLYASKTMDDTYVGILHDRISDKDATNLQSLLGRACGYGKSKDTHIFTTMQTVNNYIKTWRDLQPQQAIADQREKELRNRFRDVATTAEGASTRLAPAPTFVPPTVSAGAAPAVEPRARKQALNEDHFVSEWSEQFTTFEQAKDWIKARGGTRTQEPRMVDGVYLCSGAGKKGKISMAAVEALRGGKKTANMAAGNIKEVGKKGFRLYAAYLDMDDNTSVRFVARMLKRIAV
jgi:hypothetical protein